MTLNVEKSIRFVKDDPRWLNKLGVLFVIQVVISLINSVVQYAPDISTLYGEVSGQPEVGLVQNEFLTAGVGIVGVLLLLLIVLPYSLYLRGYLYKISLNVMNGIEHPLPDHTDIMEKFRLFGVGFLLNLGPSLLLLLLGGLLAIPGVMMGVGGVNQIVVVVYAIIAIMIFIALAVTYALLIQPTMLFIYFKSMSISRAYNLSTITAVVSEAWTEFLKVGLIFIAISIIASLLAAATWLCLLGWLVMPIVQLWLMFTQSHLYGQVYNKLNAFEL